ncbi:hypothetical protein Fmac_005232 [Flemingia macrophylla]|uniref:Uncharacterized protein n=1 Tax=Flemingia macrophylla TaxID=520843 RepID=A0ABD1N764_9FABA
MRVCLELENMLLSLKITDIFNHKIHWLHIYQRAPPASALRSVKKEPLAHLVTLKGTVFSPLEIKGTLKRRH